MTKNEVPDEIGIRRSIAEVCRELRLLRSIERALARYRTESEAARDIRQKTNHSAATSQMRRESENE